MAMRRKSMKKAMKKSMKRRMKKGKKAMKSMRRRKAKKVSKIAKGKHARASVWGGFKVKTKSGLKKSALTKNKAGKIVTKKSHAAGKKSFSRIKPWLNAVMKARKALGVKGFAVIGGKSRKGQELLKKARSFYKK